MEHLSNEDMLKFAAATGVDEKTVNHITKVHAHVLECQACREKLYAFTEEYEAELERKLDASLGEQTLRNIERDFECAMMCSEEKELEKKAKKSKELSL